LRQNGLEICRLVDRAEYSFHYFRAGLLSQMALNWLCVGAPERGVFG
jgi:hypothetical protein